MRAPRVTMVKLAEWQGKNVFRKYGVPLPRGTVARSADEAESAIRDGKVPLPCVIKAQVLAGGRGKGGAVRFANTPEEARTAAAAILAMEFKGEKVREVLLEEKLPIGRELYVSLTLDRARRLPLLIASPHGGVEIESVADSEIDRQTVDPFPGLTGYEKRRVAQVLGISGTQPLSLDRLLDSLWNVFQQEDASSSRSTRSRSWAKGSWRSTRR